MADPFVVVRNISGGPLMLSQSGALVYLANGSSYPLDNKDFVNPSVRNLVVTGKVQVCDNLGRVVTWSDMDKYQVPVPWVPPVVTPKYKWVYTAQCVGQVWSLISVSNDDCVLGGVSDTDWQGTGCTRTFTYYSGVCDPTPTDDATILVEIVGAPTCPSCSSVGSWADGQWALRPLEGSPGIYVSQEVAVAGGGVGRISLIVRPSGITPAQFCNSLPSAITDPVVTVSIDYTAIPSGCAGAAISCYALGEEGYTGPVNGHWASCCGSALYPASIEILEWGPPIHTPKISLPTITTPSTLSFNVGVISYQITTTGIVDTYGCTGLPSELSVNPATGLITGTLTDPMGVGSFNLVISATNSRGSVYKKVALTTVNGVTRTVSGTGSRFDGVYQQSYLGYHDYYSGQWVVGGARPVLLHVGQPDIHMFFDPNFGGVWAISEDSFLSNGYHYMVNPTQSTNPPTGSWVDNLYGPSATVS